MKDVALHDWQEAVAPSALDFELLFLTSRQASSFKPRSSLLQGLKEHETSQSACPSSPKLTSHVMDHIPNVNGQGLNLTIPYLLSEGHLYDRKGWRSFPTRAGYPQLADNITVQGLNILYRSIPQHDFQAFAQAWMFFGVLHEFLGEAFDEESFTRDTHNGQRVSTETVKDWEVKLSRNKSIILHRKRLPDVVIASQRLLFLRSVFAKNVLWDLFAKDKDASWAALSLSFRLIYEVIASVLEQAAFQSLEGEEWAIEMSPIPGASLDLIRAHLEGSEPAWCIHQINYLTTKLSYSALLYLTGVKRTARDGVNHSSCRLSTSCLAYNIEIGTNFSTAHTETGCICKPVEAPQEERTLILQRGGIAILSCEKKQDRSFDLHFVPASPDVEYAAISHLWFDGLGNALGNSLPFCQLTRLVDAVQATDRELCLMRPQVLLWLDVYCGPAQIPKTNDESTWVLIQKELKQHAIARMGATYAWAKYVLVFDRELMCVATKANGIRRQPPNDRHEIGTGPDSADIMAIALMAVSAWNTRCWTYQENALAKRSILQGNSCQLKISGLNLKSVVKESLQWEFLALVSRHSLMAYGLNQDVDRASTTTAPYSSNFCHAWNAFRGRTTSQWEDMIAVLATLLGLDAAAVLRLRPKDRMRAIMSSQTTLPLSLLFADLERLVPPSAAFSTRLQDRWIPKYIQSVHLECPRDGDLIQVLDHGLYLGSERLGNSARIIRLSLDNRRLRSNFHYSFRSDGTRSNFWLDVDNDQIESCVNASYWEPADIILVLDVLDPRVKIDHSIPLRGACLMPAGPVTESVEPAVFICPLEWGLNSLTFDASLQSGMGGCSPSAFPWSPEPVRRTTGVLIQSNIATWPKLPPPRSIRSQSLRTARRAVTALLSLCIPALLIGYFAAGWAIGLGLLLSLLLISAPVHGLAYIIKLQIMYSVHPELDNKSSWRRQFLAIFRLLRFRDVAIHHRPAHCVLWVLVMFISIPDVLVRNAKQVIRSGRKVKDGQDVQLEALL